MEIWAENNLITGFAWPDVSSDAICPYEFVDLCIQQCGYCLHHGLLQTAAQKPRRGRTHGRWTGICSPADWRVSSMGAHCSGIKLW